MPFPSNSDAAAGADQRAATRLDGAIADVFLADDARLDDRTRLTVQAALRRLIGGIEADVRRHAGRLLASRGEAEESTAMLGAADRALPLLAGAGLLRDAGLMAELIARARIELMAQCIPVVVAQESRPSLLVRLTELPDRLVADAARALMAAESRSDTVESGLPVAVQHRLVWWVTAAIMASLPATAASDRALADAAQRCLAAHDEANTPQAIADQLVTAIDPHPTQIPTLLLEAMGDRRLNLVASLLAKTARVDGGTVRALLIEPDNDLLWVALRLVGLAREEIARVALSLAEADPRRDMDAFAGRLDEFAAVAPAAAREMIAPLTLPRDLRLAVLDLADVRR